MSVLQCSFIFLLLLCLPVLSEAKRQPGQGKPDKPRQPPPTPQPAKRARNRSVPGSGELTTKEGHRCVWQTSGEGLVSLLVNCSTETADQQRYWCRYAGKPDLCQAYGVKSSQYWKQLVGKLKKRQNACEGEKVLKAKTCKKAPTEAHMKLAHRSGEEERKGGKKKGATASKSSDGGKAERRKKKEEEEEEEKKKREERTGFEEEGVVNDMEPVQSYCSEGWHSVCSFFVKFFEG
ncbi:fibroblast growth factor-binding protein 2 [Chaetodon auriga]|uniref:fibroblast growth factor-binding protein 2 n=1 Tax=Chaetodon auriga TaxID=39042 RepID=UPI0040329CD4